MSNDPSRSLRELSAAIERGDVGAVEAALNEEPSLVDARTADADTLLHIACWQKQLALVRLLVARGADVDAQGWHRRTPMHYAVHNADPNTLAIVALLREHGADPALQDADGFDVEARARQELDDAAFARLLPVLHLDSSAPGAPG